MSIPGRIGPFQIEAELGRGGHGVVYRARDERLDRLVAIKAIAARLSADEARMARFRDEARIIAQLNHAHIAQIHQLLEDDGKTYLVLEYVAGRSLAHVLRGGPPELASGLRMLSQVADALASAHAHGIIHRDLKPDNILVTGEGHAKVLDFGIACIAPSPTDADPAAPTMVGGPSGEPAMLGTPGYMSPEQCRGEPADARADVFSFGCVLYECLCGHPAIPGRTTADRIAATLTARADFGRLPVGLPDGLGSLVRACLAPRADDRPGSIQDVRLVLRRAMGEAAAPTPTPDAAEPARARTNLPRAMDHFIGRGEEVAELMRVLDDRSMVTLIGGGGCGKTRLAIELGRRLTPRFAGGVWLAELATSDASRAPGSIAVAVGARDEAGTLALDAIAAKIGQSPVLLILDNCEHVRDAVRGLASTLLARCAGLHVLATSREPLGAAGEVAWRVPALGVPGGAARSGGRASTPISRANTPATTTPARTPTGGWSVDDLLACESVSLFIDRAREVRPGFELDESNAAAIASICRRLDGIPLAIELAAARTAMLSPAQIERHLDDRFRLLRSAGGRAERHQTLRAAIDWSYDMLDERSRQALQKLAVFKEGCDLDGACAVLGHDADVFETLDVLTILSDKSLLVSEYADAQARYRMLETVRAYALERLGGAGGLDAALGGRLRAYAQLAAGAKVGLTGPDQGAWVERLSASGEDLLDAIDDAATREPRTAQQICADVWRYWWIRGRMRDGLAACVRACAADPEPTPARADALYAAGALAWALGELESAVALQEESLAIQRELGDDRGAASALNSLGLIANDRGDLPAAERLFAESLAIKRRLGDRRGIAMSLNNLGIAARLSHRLVEAKASYAESAEILRSLGDHRAVARTLMNLAEIAMESGDLGVARRGFEEARESFAGTDDRQGIAMASANLSAVLQQQTHGEPAPHACGPLAEAVEIFQEIGDRRGLLDAVDQAAALAADAGDASVAARLGGAADETRRAWSLPRDASREAITERLAIARRSSADGDAWASAEEEGRAMDPERLVETALAWLAGHAAASPP